MKRRIIEIGTPAREKLAEGAKILYEGVARTLGPFGDNWFLDKKGKITNDGVKIAEEIQLNDEVQNRGAKALREAALKTNDEAGDGTTTAIILAYRIYQEASRFLSRGKVLGQKSASEVILQVERERQEVTQTLKDMATPIETEQDLINSAIVSVEDRDLGELIGKTQWELGRDGVIIAETTAERVSSIEKVSGIRIDNGVSSTNVINDFERQQLNIQKVKVILTSHTIRTLEDLKQILDELLKLRIKDVAIIARAWTEDAIRDCEMNFKNGNHFYPLNAPYVDMKEIMKDIAAVLGATFYDSDSTDIKDIQLSDVGYAEKIVAGRYDAILTGVKDTEATQRTLKRADDLKEQLKGSQSDFEKKNLSVRIAQLENGFALLKVGSPSDMERLRLFDKCEDAVNAVRAAFQEGTVKGGGLAYKEIAESLPDDYILKKPLMAPYEQIMSTAPADFIIEPWVRDPVKVLRIALEKACLAASSFATAGGVSTEKFPDSLDELLRKPGSE